MTRPRQSYYGSSRDRRQEPVPLPWRDRIMKQTKQMRTAKPRRESARPTVELTHSMWQRIADLPEKLRAQQKEREAAEKARAEAYARIKPTAGDRAYDRWMARNRRKRGTLGPQVAAKLLRIPADVIVREARAAGVLLDFGVSAYPWLAGRRNQFILYRDLAKVAKARASAAA